MPTAAASSPNSEMMMGKPTSTQLVKVITLMNTPRRGAWMCSRPAIQMPSPRLMKIVIMGSGRHTTISHSFCRLPTLVSTLFSI